MDFHRPREYDPTLIQLHSERLNFQRCLGIDYSEELERLDDTHNTVPLETYVELQAKYQQLTEEHQTYRIQQDSARQMERTARTLVLSSLEQYKTQLETLRAKDHLNMQLIASLQRQIEDLERKTGLKAVPEGSLPTANALELISKEVEADAKLLEAKENMQNAEIKAKEEAAEAKLLSEKLMKRLVEEKQRADKAVQAAKRAIEYAKQQVSKASIPSCTLVSAVPALKQTPAVPSSKQTLNCTAIRASLSNLRHFVSTINQKMPILLVKQVKDALSSSALLNSALLQDVSSKYLQELFERRRLYNIVQELKGNIRVICRVRPCFSAQTCVSSREDCVVVMTDQRLGTVKEWEFDRVLGSASTQEDVFDCIKPLLQSAIDGYNVCIFAYGQTGSGKTYTMEGPSDQPGVNYRTAKELFRLIDTRKPAWNYQISGSMLEIYNDKVKDLLGSGEKLRVRHGETGVNVPEATLVRVNDATEVTLLLDSGCTQRAIGQTNMNQHSSRSHLILTLTIKGECEGVQTCSRLHLIDLAGSERLDKSGSEGDRLREATHINKSLFALGDVLTAKRLKQPHVPYRNSTLTHLLQDSLSGDSKVVMVLQVSPELEAWDETMCSLQFGAKARSTELGAARRRTST